MYSSTPVDDVWITSHKVVGINRNDAAKPIRP